MESVNILPKTQDGHEDFLASQIRSISHWNTALASVFSFVCGVGKGNIETYFSIDDAK